MQPIFKDHLPYYLTDGREELVKAFDQFDRGEAVNYYSQLYPEDILQGDGWRGFPIANITSPERRYVRAIILSNTCDISFENPRILPHRIIFSPLIKLNEFIRLLKEQSASDEKINSQVDAIRRQFITNIFYLPPGGAIDEEYIARLDHIYSAPATFHEKSPEREKLFTLSQFGHYVFLFKLSVHFCRFQEDIARGQINP